VTPRMRPQPWPRSTRAPLAGDSGSRPPVQHGSTHGVQRGCGVFSFGFLIADGASGRSIFKKFNTFAKSGGAERRGQLQGLRQFRAGADSTHAGGDARLEVPAECLISHASLPVAAVEIVSHDEVARLKTVDAELVRAARLRMKFQQAHEWMRRKGAVLARGWLTAWVRSHAAAIGAVRPEGPVPRSFARLWPAPHQGEVHLFARPSAMALASAAWASRSLARSTSRRYPRPNGARDKGRPLPPREIA